MTLQTVGYFFPLLIGFVTLLIGIIAMAKPEMMSKQFGIAVNGIALPYVRSLGIRDIFMGLVVLILFHQQAWVALGATHLCLGLVAVSDFLVVLKHGDKKASLTHLAGAVMVFAYGAWLLLGAGLQA